VPVVQSVLQLMQAFAKIRRLRAARAKPINYSTINVKYFTGNFVIKDY
jgi:hypothetical protein